MPRQYPLHFRHDMVNRMLACESGLSLVQETAGPEQTLHRWNHQALVDKGLVDAVGTTGSTELRVVNKRSKSQIKSSNSSRTLKVV